MGRVVTMMEDHIAGRANYTDELDKVMTVVVFHRMLDPREAPTVPTAAQSHYEMAIEINAPI